MADGAQDLPAVTCAHGLGVASDERSAHESHDLVDDPEGRDEVERIREEREPPFGAAEHRPRHAERDERSEEHDEQEAAFRRPQPADEAGYRETRQYRSEARIPFVEPHPFVAERIHEDAAHGVVGGGDRPRFELVERVV